MRELLWRPRAQLDRESIAIYLGQQRASPQAALEAIAGIDKALETACAFPESGSRFGDDKLEGEYRSVLAGNYRIFYQYDDASLTVYRILHQRQDIDDYSFVQL